MDGKHNIRSSSCRSLNGENDDKNCLATLLDLEALDCPSCCDALTIPIIQCNEGHIACSTCCNKLRNKCPSCDSPVGQIRCRPMERVIKAVIVSCPNAKLGCTKSFSYGTELTHEKECTFSRCYCPAENCDYTGSYKDIYSHDLSSRSSSGENDDMNCSATLFDLEALNCPICCDALTSSIYQCDNGHIACSTCFNKLGNTCHSCDFSIGKIRCRVMERVIKGVIVPCPNAKLGCTKSFSYATELTHEKECTFSRCYCPAENCDYTGSYKDIYYHDFDIHRGGRVIYQIIFGEYVDVYFEWNNDSVVMQDSKDGLLFVVQCFREPHGVYVTMSCIAPSAPEVGDFFCHITTAIETYTTRVRLPKVKRVRKLRLEIPEEDFMLVPSYLLRERQALNLRIRMSKLNQE